MVNMQIFVSDNQFDDSGGIGTATLTHKTEFSKIRPL